MERQIIDALTGEVTIIEITAKDQSEMVGKIEPKKSLDEIATENQILKDAAIAKLATLGLTIEEAQLILGGSN
jgi:hypothetical protein